MTAGQFAVIVTIVLILMGVVGGIAYNVAQSRNQDRQHEEYVGCLTDVFGGADKDC